MRDAIAIRLKKPVNLSRLPDRSDSDTYYRKMMEQCAKEECRAIYATNKLYGRFHKDDALNERAQLSNLAWAMNTKITFI